jgi:nucleotide-binding universal stress UspA family protein
MYEHLLVALDGSEAAEQVLGHVEALASAFQSTVTLLHAIVSMETLVAQSASSGPGMGDLSPPVDPEPILDAERSSTAEYLAGVSGRLRERGITVTTEMPQGDPADAIVERAEALGVSLILMTTHGRGGLGRLVFGSTADAVLRRARCPLLLVRISDG